MTELTITVGPGRTTRFGYCSICATYDVMRRTWCSKHYQRWVKYGDPTVVNQRPVGPQAKISFTPQMWARWLAEFNRRSTEPNAQFRKLLTRKHA